MGPVLIALAASVAVADNALGSWLGVWARGGVFGVLGVAAASAGAWELARLQQDKGVASSPMMMAAAALVGLATAGVGSRLPDSGDAAVLMVSAGAATLLAAVLVYSRDRAVEGMFSELAGVLLSFLYLGGLLGLYVAMRADHDSWVVLWLLLSVKSSDIGAFFSGRSFGKHRLAPWISPGKTWEGLAGGVALASVIGGVGAWALATSGVLVIGVVWGALLGAMLAVAGQVGDLVISLLKRDAGRKDASGALPGFGGVLDVLDSLLLAAPVAFWGLRAFSGDG